MWCLAYVRVYDVCVVCIVLYVRMCVCVTVCDVCVNEESREACCFLPSAFGCLGASHPCKVDFVD